MTVGIWLGLYFLMATILFAASIAKHPENIAKILEPTTQTQAFFIFMLSWSGWAIAWPILFAKWMAYRAPKESGS